MAAFLGMKKIEHRMQICLRNQRIACCTDLVDNIPLRKLNKSSRHLKICVPSTMHALIKVYPTIPLSGPSKLVRRYI